MQFLEFFTRPEVLSVLSLGLGYLFHRAKAATQADIERWTRVAFGMAWLAVEGHVLPADEDAFLQRVLSIARGLAQQAGIKNVNAAQQLRVLALGRESLTHAKLATYTPKVAV